MAYRLYSQKGDEISLHDLQDKGPWCAAGASYEEVFVNKHGRAFNIMINPEKRTNPYAPDLLNINTKNIGDLKTQNTPFFQAQGRYSIDPQFAVTFNVKDYNRYLEFYPAIEIYFWVSWLATKFVGNNTINVNPMEGVWHISFKNIITAAKNAPVHRYQQRVNDKQGNAKDSFVFNLQNKLFERLV